ncbi:unnamed protein product [Symbiodinium natans]|uniref:Uncharacterized protein n=1 Tax=Symbiodinium natans TaxID=878477 RepID=A0A812TT49_9DINO|nr:unnamed protein product [Symbiodinium natans]
MTSKVFLEAAFKLGQAFVEANDIKYSLSSKDVLALGGSELSRLSELFESDYEWSQKGRALFKPPQQRVVDRDDCCGDDHWFLHWIAAYQMPRAQTAQVSPEHLARRRDMGTSSTRLPSEEGERREPVPEEASTSPCDSASQVESFHTWPPAEVVQLMEEVRKEADLENAISSVPPPLRPSARRLHEKRVADRWAVCEGRGGCMAGLLRCLLPAFPRPGQPVEGAVYTSCGEVAAFLGFAEELRATHVRSRPWPPHPQGPIA